MHPIGRWFCVWSIDPLTRAGVRRSIHVDVCAHFFAPTGQEEDSGDSQTTQRVREEVQARRATGGDLALMMRNAPHHLEMMFIGCCYRPLLPPDGSKKDVTEGAAAETEVRKYDAQTAPQGRCPRRKAEAQEGVEKGQRQNPDCAVARFEFFVRYVSKEEKHIFITRI